MVSEMGTLEKGLHNNFKNSKYFIEISAEKKVLLTLLDTQSLTNIPVNKCRYHFLFCVIFCHD